MVIDHNGKAYSDEKKMCEAWEINYSAYQARRKRGWSLKDALTLKSQKPDNMQNVIQIVEQYEPEDVLRALEEYEKNHGKLRPRKNRSVEAPGNRDNYVYDHEGHFFRNKREMCDYWKIPFSVFHNRDIDGWPYCYSLTYPKGGPYVFADHENREFKSIGKMCKFHGIGKYEFAQRMNDGWSLKDALTLPAGSKKQSRTQKNKSNPVSKKE